MRFWKTARTKRVSGLDWASLCLDALKSGPVRLRATGFSMEPWLYEGDLLEVSPLEGAGASAEDLVLLQTADGYAVLHRLKKIEDGQAELEASGGSLHRVPATCIAGRARLLQRNVWRRLFLNKDMVGAFQKLQGWAGYGRLAQFWARPSARMSVTLARDQDRPDLARFFHAPRIPAPERGAFFLARWAGRPAGAVEALREDGRWWISGLYVRIRYRRLGIAEVLMDAAHAHLEALGTREIDLLVQREAVGAVALYSKLKYVEVGGEAPEGMARLRRTLTPAPRNVADAAAQLYRERALAEILDTFAAAGIRCLTLRGMAFANTLYTPSELRPMADIDLVFPPEQLRQAQAVLTGLGFRLWPCGELNVIRWDTCVELEPGFWYRKDFEDVFSRAREFQVCGRRAKTPCTRDSFWDLVFATLHSGALFPERREDALRLMRSEDFSWNELREETVSRGWEAALALFLKALGALPPDMPPAPWFWRRLWGLEFEGKGYLLRLLAFSGAARLSYLLSYLFPGEDFISRRYGPGFWPVKAALRPPRLALSLVLGLSRRLLDRR